MRRLLLPLPGPTATFLHDPAALPELPREAAWLLALLLATIWIALRIRLLRARQARRGPDDPPAPAWPWLARLSKEPWILPALAVLALLLLAAAAWVFASRPGS